MVNKELGNTATCIKEYAGNDLDTSNIYPACQAMNFEKSTEGHIWQWKPKALRLDQSFSLPGYNLAYMVFPNWLYSTAFRDLNDTVT